MSDVTRLIEAAAAGDPKAAADLLPLVYAELRRLAAARMANERPDHTLDATGLVHEAFLRLVGDRVFASTGQFYRAAGMAMRHILVDHARARGADKRGGDRRRVDLTDVSAPLPHDQLLALDEALADLGRHDPVAAELVQLRYFSGLGHGDAADALGLSRRQADGLWAVARAWLFRRLHDS